MAPSTSKANIHLILSILISSDGNVLAGMRIEFSVCNVLDH